MSSTYVEGGGWLKISSRSLWNQEWDQDPSSEQMQSGDNECWASSWPMVCCIFLKLWGVLLILFLIWVIYLNYFHRKYLFWKTVHTPACFCSSGEPLLCRTSISTRSRDMSPRVRPDIVPPNKTKMIEMHPSMKVPHEAAGSLQTRGSSDSIKVFILTQAVKNFDLLEMEIDLHMKFNCSN